jgi:hypothetical protein
VATGAGVPAPGDSGTCSATGSGAGSGSAGSGGGSSSVAGSIGSCSASSIFITSQVYIPRFGIPPNLVILASVLAEPKVKHMMLFQVSNGLSYILIILRLDDIETACLIGPKKENIGR